MLHNKGNTIPYYGEDFSGYATSPTHKTILLIMCNVIVFLIFKIMHQKIFKFLLLIYYF